MATMDVMATAFMVVLFLGTIGMLFGALIALPTVFPPLKTLAQRFASFRLALAFSLGLIAFLILFAFHTYSLALGGYLNGITRYHCQSCDAYGPFPTEEEAIYRDAIILENWTRSILPPPLQTPCNTGNEVACHLAGEFNPSWDGFLFTFLVSYMGTLSSVACVAFYTRERKREPFPDEQVSAAMENG